MAFFCNKIFLAIYISNVTLSGLLLCDALNIEVYNPRKIRLPMSGFGHPVLFATSNHRKSRSPRTSQGNSDMWTSLEAEEEENSQTDEAGVQQQRTSSRRRFIESLSTSACMLSSISFLSIATDPTPSFALSPEQASTDYDSYSANYDSLDGGKAADILGIEEARSNLFREAKGSVLEIGAGTGLNLNKYDPSKVSSLTLVDISDGMLQEAKKRLPSVSPLNDVPVKFIRADATSSELVDMFGEYAFDTVVDSFSLCVMGNDGAKRCLEQLSRVVKKSEDGGLVLLLENSRSSNPLLGLYQDATADAAASTGGKGCVYNQDVASLIRSTRGMIIKNEEPYAAGLFRSFRCTVE